MEEALECVFEVIDSMSPDQGPESEQRESEITFKGMHLRCIIFRFYTPSESEF